MIFEIHLFDGGRRGVIHMQAVLADHGEDARAPGEH